MELLLEDVATKLDVQLVVLPSYAYPSFATL